MPSPEEMTKFIHVLSMTACVAGVVFMGLSVLWWVLLDRKIAIPTGIVAAFFFIVGYIAQ